jgi:hypothetical protein
MVRSGFSNPYKGMMNKNGVAKIDSAVVFSANPITNNTVY